MKFALEPGWATADTKHDEKKKDKQLACMMSVVADE
jgi:hypothetical protein